MEINHPAELALNFLQNTRTNIFLTGKAGTGKTTFLKKLKEISLKRMVVVAPTGVAAMNAGGVTIHSFFQLPFGPFLPGKENMANEYNASGHKFSREKINIIRSMDLLVIDEVSMVRADLLDAISHMLCRFKDPDKPFGGVQLLLIGDMQQLAPVAKEDEWNLLRAYYPSTFFFDSKALSASNYLCIELTHVYRQDDNTFINLLNNIREGRFDSDTLAALNQRYIPNFLPNEDEGYITLTTHNYMAQQTNTQRLNELRGKMYSFKAEIEDDFPAYAYPTDEQLDLKKGAQVMFVKNDSSGDHRYYNGKIGKVVFINKNKIIVCDAQGNEINVERETWENIKYTINPETKEITETISGSFNQYPLKTAWAITIHKSQGLTFDHAIIDAASAFSHGQVYVALSRCKTLEGMVLNSRITPNALIKDERVASYTQSLAQRRPGEEQLLKAQRNYFMEELSELFDFHPLQNRLYRLSTAVYTHLKTLYPQRTQTLMTARDTFRTEITEVGERFHLQLIQLISNSRDYRNDTFIQERVCKGAHYFIEKLQTRFIPVIEQFDLEIDNKEIRKQIENALLPVKEEADLKLAVLEACKEGFDLLRYLSVKAKAVIDLPEKKKKAKRETAAPSTDTGDIRYPELYERIRQWRYEQATAKKLPAYMILQQKALIGIANSLPISGKELKNISGIGTKTLELYGKELLKIILDYKNDHSR